MPEFEKLAVRREAYQLALRTYALTEALLGVERYAMCNQMRRASVVVPPTSPRVAGV
jgi:four helix bundle protein